MITHWFLKTIGILFLLGIWFLSSYIFNVSQLIVPSPVSVFDTTVENILNITLFEHTLITILRVALISIIMIIISIPLGIAIGLSEKLYLISRWPVDFFRSIPASALLPIFWPIFGIQEGSIYAVSIFASVLILTVYITGSIKSLNPLRRSHALVLGATQFDIIYKLLLPESLPHIFSAIKVTVPIVLIIVIVAEMVNGVNSGLGKAILNSGQSYEIESLWSYVLVAGGIGVLINQLLLEIEKRIVFKRY